MQIFTKSTDSLSISSQFWFLHFNFPNDCKHKQDGGSTEFYETIEYGIAPELIFIETKNTLTNRISLLQFTFFALISWTFPFVCWWNSSKIESYILAFISCIVFSLYVCFNLLCLFWFSVAISYSLVSRSQNIAIFYFRFFFLYLMLPQKRTKTTEKQDDMMDLHFCISYT